MQPELTTLFHPCRQCGACCMAFRKVLLQPDEVEFIRKMGGHVGVELSLSDVRDRHIDDLAAEAEARGNLYMVHPDGKGCVFLERRNDTYRCKIYHYRPKSCQGFRCNLADGSIQGMVGNDAMHLLGRDRFGLPLKS